MIMQNRKNKGFTLIEIIIVIVMIAIITSFSLVSYRSSVVKSMVAEGRRALVEMSANIERMRLEGKAYNSDAISDYFGEDANKNVYYSGKLIYTLTLSDTSISAYTLTATSEATQVPASNTCHVMTINQLGTFAPIKCK